MQAFNNDRDLKRRVVGFATALSPRVGDSDRHRTREKLWWSSRTWCEAGYVCRKSKGHDGKECDHRFYADQIGVPVAIAYAERALFLDLPTAQARTWMSRFLEAIPVGVDLAETKVFNRLALYVLADPTYGLVTFAYDGEQHEALSRVIELFESDSQDAEAWEAASAACRRANHKSPYDNRQMNAEDSLKHAGCQACSAADYFARCFVDQRNAAPAIQWSAWSHRYKLAAQYMAANANPEADKHDWFRTSRIANEGDHRGEIERHNQYVRIAERFIALLRKAESNHTAVHGTGFRQLLRRLGERLAA